MDKVPAADVKGNNKHQDALAPTAQDLALVA